jgi:hypothetical protein
VCVYWVQQALLAEELSIENLNSDSRPPQQLR